MVVATRGSVFLLVAAAAVVAAAVLVAAHDDHDDHGDHGHAHTHAHSHGHGDAPAPPPAPTMGGRQMAMKPQPGGGHSHGHGHGHGHDHGDHGDHGGHSHGGHAAHAAHGGHSHGGHDHNGHSHGGHGGHGGHSHGGHGHGHGHGGHGHADPEDAHADQGGFFESGAGAGDPSVLDIILDYMPHDTAAQAVLATVLISVLPIFMVFFIPIENMAKDQKARADKKAASSSSKKDGAAGKTGSAAAESDSSLDLLQVLVAFAVGGLLGDVFLHLIPHALVPHDHGGGEDDGHSHGHSHSHGSGGDGHEGHDHGAAIQVGLLILGGMLAFFLLEKIARMRAGDEGGSHGGHSHSHGSGGSEGSGSMSRVTGLLNIIADAAHNFTDGMAIGASYLASPMVGLSTTIAVFFHEIPHEVGDYAILIQSGYTKREAMMVQLLTALAALSGTLATIWAGEVAQHADAVILPFAAGGFIYIATVNIIPALLNSNDTWQQLVAEVAAMAVGVSTMVVIAMYE